MNIWTKKWKRKKERRMGEVAKETGNRKKKRKGGE